MKLHLVHSGIPKKAEPELARLSFRMMDLRDVFCREAPKAIAQVGDDEALHTERVRLEIALSNAMVGVHALHWEIQKKAKKLAKEQKQQRAEK